MAALALHFLFDSVDAFGVLIAVLDGGFGGGMGGRSPFTSGTGNQSPNFFNPTFRVLDDILKARHALTDRRQQIVFE
ncbi:MAG: hypothetical protein JNK48_18860 [Bryobacterales bacterium]|nr:hypothetical protein [Bryobacterales bacterium]